MNEDFVSFDLAKKLKEKGYPQDPDNMNCMPYYEYDEVINATSLCNDIVWYASSEPRDDIFAAPTIHKVLKWLREEHHIHFEVVGAAYGYNLIISDTPYKGGTDRYFTHANDDGPNDGGAWDKYEDCVMYGIEYVLDNLI